MTEGENVLKSPMVRLNRAELMKLNLDTLRQKLPKFDGKWSHTLKELNGFRVDKNKKDPLLSM